MPNSIDPLVDHSPLTVEEAAVWHAMKHMSERSFALVGKTIEAASGLSGADYGILTRLEDLGAGTLQQHELAKLLGWNKSRLSQQLTRMEARALVRRVVHAARKGVTVSILAAGRGAIAAARPVHAAAVRHHVLRHLRPQEARMIINIAGRLE